jgi:hypothetical protein
MLSILVMKSHGKWLGQGKVITTSNNALISKSYTAKTQKQ